MRRRRYPFLVLVAAAIVLSFFYLRPEARSAGPSRAASTAPKPDLPIPTKPLPPSGSSTHVAIHPIEALVAENEQSFQAIVNRQSKTLAEAVAEYKRRYGIPPPPRFDDWYKFARNRGTLMIDEYDTIHHTLLPFWGLKPSTIRARVREALGYDGNWLIAVMIRSGKVSHYQAGPEWQQLDTIEMMSGFIDMLPDMDLAFNIHDEPRVVVPYDDLDRLVSAGKARHDTLAAVRQRPRNSFTLHSIDLWKGNRVMESRTTRFNEYPRQSVWTPSRLSCSPDTPARALEEDQRIDNVQSYAVGSLGFISNHTAFSDICNSPSFATSHGFLERPNVYKVVHELLPIFSFSKLSSYQDILYPAPWYWNKKKIVVDQTKDVDWAEKTSDLYWVGSTTGGYSLKGGWRNHHRQRIVQRLNAKDKAKVMVNRASVEVSDTTTGNAAKWTTIEVDRADYKELIDVHFSEIGQCEKNDCAAQNEFFEVVPKAKFNDFWTHKFLLDMDGNAFSGRFHAFLKSNSLPIKMNIFREWTEEWIRPWVHYVPFGLKADEVLEQMRYFVGEDEGRDTAERLARQGKEWAESVLRRQDMEVWMFRLLLEYARVVDDDRDGIGFDVHA